jgi:hypothetical protein
LCFHAHAKPLFLPQYFKVIGIE